LTLPSGLGAARRPGAEAIHPGYGFFSERGDAAEAVQEAGLVWIGPPPEAARAVGDKVRARQLASGAGVSVVPGTLQSVQEPGEVHAFGEEHGYPIAIKAAGGGGGRGLRVAARPGEVPEAFAAATGEADVAVANACGYVNAGTVEFLVDEDGRFYFLEVNARLQVEHTITEEVLGVDLVACQLRIAAGDPLGFSQSDLPKPRGHALEC